MRVPTLFFLLFIANGVYSQSLAERTRPAPPVWKLDSKIEPFWKIYAASKGGLTWGKSSQYPDYTKVKEGDLFMVELEQGVCLMEFFHGRWRRANDVRRWDDSVNQYGGCPYVFD